MTEERIWTAALLVIGDEILSGRTHDRNIAQVASWLKVQGIRLAEVRVVPDVEERIAEAVNALRTAHDYLFTTGGIGPTHDDITVDAVAEALGVPVVVHPEARAILEAYYATRGGLTEARLRMARVPEGADLIENRMSGAPGIRIGNVHMMAGVPHIAAQMLDALTGTLEGGAPLLSETIGCWVPESEVADLLREVEHAHARLPDRQLPVLPRRPGRRQFRDPLDRLIGSGGVRGEPRGAARTGGPGGGPGWDSSSSRRRGAGRPLVPMYQRVDPDIAFGWSMRMPHVEQQHPVAGSDHDIVIATLSALAPPGLDDRLAEHQRADVADRRRAVAEHLVIIGLEVEGGATPSHRFVAQRDMLLIADEIARQLGRGEVGADPFAGRLALLLEGVLASSAPSPARGSCLRSGCRCRAGRW